jgi:hypothetical protein
VSKLTALLVCLNSACRLLLVLMQHEAVTTQGLFKKLLCFEKYFYEIVTAIQQIVQLRKTVRLIRKTLLKSKFPGWSG